MRNLVPFLGLALSLSFSFSLAAVTLLRKRRENNEAPTARYRMRITKLFFLGN